MWMRLRKKGMASRCLHRRCDRAIRFDRPGMVDAMLTIFFAGYSLLVGPPWNMLRSLHPRGIKVPRPRMARYWSMSWQVIVLLSVLSVAPCRRATRCVNLGWISQFMPGYQFPPLRPYAVRGCAAAFQRRTQCIHQGRTQSRMRSTGPMETN